MKCEICGNEMSEGVTRYRTPELMNERKIRVYECDECLYEINEYELEIENLKLEISYLKSKIKNE